MWFHIITRSIWHICLVFMISTIIYIVYIGDIVVALFIPMHVSWGLFIFEKQFLYGHKHERSHELRNLNLLTYKMSFYKNVL